MRGDLLDHVLAAAARTGQDDPAKHHRQRNARAAARHIGSRAGQAGRPGRTADQPQPRRRAFHRRYRARSPIVEEYLYSAMEDYKIDIVLDKGPSARSIQIELAPFTLIGATTRSGLLTSPLRARFGIQCHLEYYDAPVLAGIVRRSARILDVSIDDDAAHEVALRSRGTPASPTPCCAACATSQWSRAKGTSIWESPESGFRRSTSTRAASTRWTTRYSAPSSKSSARAPSG